MLPELYERPLGIAHLLAPADVRAPLLWCWNQPRRPNPHQLLFAARDARELVDHAVRAAVVFGPLPGMPLMLQYQYLGKGNWGQWLGLHPMWAYAGDAGDPVLLFPPDPPELRPFLEERAASLWAEALAALRHG